MVLIHAETFAELAAAWLRWKFLPFRNSVSSSAIPLGNKGPSGSVSPKDICGLVTAMGERVPFRAVCFQRGLAAQRMLRRRGFDAILHYGVVNLPQELSAHVWVSIDDEIVLGAGGMKGHVEVARFPSL